MTSNHHDFEKTRGQWRDIVTECRDLFEAKTSDYGPSWLLFRLPSITDQILIKIKRIRQLDELGGEGKIPEGIDSEFRGIINYCIMALIKLWYKRDINQMELPLMKGLGETDIKVETLMQYYDEVVRRVEDLMMRKNHDYGEAWRHMRPTSIIDEILVKTYRIRKIEAENKELAVSEGLDAQYSDILNYSVFALIQLNEQAAG